MRILVAMEVHEEHKRWIEEAAQGHEVVYWPVKGLVSASVSEEELAKADVVIGNVVPAQLRHARRLRWLQLSSAGADAYCKDGVMPDGAALTNATGAFGLAIAEHMTALVFAMMKKLYQYYDNQKDANWRDEGQVESVYGKTVLVIGFGDLGRQFGKRMKAMGAHVVGMRRRSGDVPPEADEMGAGRFMRRCPQRSVSRRCRRRDGTGAAAGRQPDVAHAGALRYAARIGRISFAGYARQHRSHCRRQPAPFLSRRGAGKRRRLRHRI